MSQAPPAGQANMREALPAGQANMREALHAEWTKLRTAPGTIWLLLALIALTVALGTAVAAAVTCPSGGCNQDPTKLSLTGIGLGQAAIAILAVLAVSGEYSTGMIRITLTAMPRRPTVLAAKATILTGMTLGAGTLAVAGCLLAGRLLLPPNGFTPAHGYQPLSLADGPTLRAAAGSVLYLALIPCSAWAPPPPCGTPPPPSGWCSACSTCSRSSPRRSPTRTGSGTSSSSDR